MHEIDKKYSDNIKIPDVENGITNKNANMFVFPQSQYALLGKKAMLLLCAMFGLFVIWLLPNLKNNTLLFWFVTILLLIVAIWYQYEYRVVRYYKKASKGSRPVGVSSAYTLKYINKIVNSKNVYAHDMPICYYLLKCRQLIEQDEIIKAEVLVECALKEYPKCFELWYVQGVLAYMSEEYDTAYEKLYAVSSERHIDKEMKVSALSLLQEMKSNK